MGSTAPPSAPSQDLPEPRVRRRIRRIFLALFVLLPLQYGLVGLVGVQWSEPWPALVMPGFQQVWEREGAVVVEDPELLVEFTAGDSVQLSVEEFLKDLPRSHHRALMERQCRPRVLSGSADTERCLQQDVAEWSGHRLRQLYPDRQPVRLVVEWRELAFQAGALGEGPEVWPLAALTIDLP